jgi:hypothetical protein
MIALAEVASAQVQVIERLADAVDDVADVERAIVVARPLAMPVAAVEVAATAHWVLKIAVLC